MTRKPVRRSSRAAAEGPISTRDSDPPAQRTLRVRSVWGDLTQVGGSVVLVGHYAGVSPQRAEAALDRWVSDRADGDLGRCLITALTRRGGLRGDLGELHLFPAPNGRLGAVAGMGVPGTFGPPQVRQLARTVTQSVGLLPWHQSLTTVVVGSGEGNLPIQVAVREFLTATIGTLIADPELALTELTFIECSLDRALQVREALAQAEASFAQRPVEAIALDIDTMLGECPGGRIPPDFGCSMLLAGLGRDDDRGRALLQQALDMLPEEARQAAREWMTRHASADFTPDGLRRGALRFRLAGEVNRPDSGPAAMRIAAWHEGHDLHLTAITSSTTVTERVLARKLPLAQRASERLRFALPEKRLDAGRRLRRHLVHGDFRELLDENRVEPLVLELDVETAALPWEMIPSGLAVGADSLYRPLALNRPLARQLRTRYSPRPYEPPRRTSLKALVVGDPGNGALALPAAQEEAVAVAGLLRKLGLHCELLVGAPNPGTGASPVDNEEPADYAETVDRLLSGEFDLVHFCGHGRYDPQRADQTGWVFDELQMLTGADLEGAERPPRLVFANACDAAQLLQPQDGPIRLDLRQAAGLADTFLQQGVRHFIAPAWPVQADPARDFALTFYRALFGTERCTIGEALLVARAEVKQHDNAAPGQGSGIEGAALVVWAAYQHYGDPTERFDRPSRSEGAITSEARTNVKGRRPTKSKRREAR